MISVQKRKLSCSPVKSEIAAVAAGDATGNGTNYTNQTSQQKNARKRSKNVTSKSISSVVPSNTCVKQSTASKRSSSLSEPARNSPASIIAPGAGSGCQAGSSGDESVWIFGLINNIEQLLSTFNTAISTNSGQTAACSTHPHQNHNHQHHHSNGTSTGPSTPSSCLSSSASSPTSATCSSSSTSSNSPASSTPSSSTYQHMPAHSEPARPSAAAAVASIGASLPRSPISRQIKFHEYKGPPSAKRQQNQSPAIGASTKHQANTPSTNKQQASHELSLPTTSTKQQAAANKKLATCTSLPAASHQQSASRVSVGAKQKVEADRVPNGSQLAGPASAKAAASTSAHPYLQLQQQHHHNQQQQQPLAQPPPMTATAPADFILQHRHQAQQSHHQLMHEQQLDSRQVLSFQHQRVTCAHSVPIQQSHMMIHQAAARAQQQFVSAPPPPNENQLTSAGQCNAVGVYNQQQQTFYAGETAASAAGWQTEALETDGSPLLLARTPSVAFVRDINNQQSAASASSCAGRSPTDSQANGRRARPPQSAAQPSLASAELQQTTSPCPPQQPVVFMRPSLIDFGNSSSGGGELLQQQQCGAVGGIASEDSQVSALSNSEQQFLAPQHEADESSQKQPQVDQYQADLFCRYGQPADSLALSAGRNLETMSECHRFALMNELAPFGSDSEETTDASEIEPSIGGFSSDGVEELLFSEYINLEDVPMNVDESDWLKKFLPPCSMS